MQERKEANNQILTQLRAIADKPGFGSEDFLNEFKQVIRDERIGRRLERMTPQAIEASLPESDEDETLVEEPVDEYINYPENTP